MQFQNVQEVGAYLECLAAVQFPHDCGNSDSIQNVFLDFELQYMPIQPRAHIQPNQIQRQPLQPPQYHPHKNDSAATQTARNSLTFQHLSSSPAHAPPLPYNLRYTFSVRLPYKERKPRKVDLTRIFQVEFQTLLKSNTKAKVLLFFLSTLHPLPHPPLYLAHLLLQESWKEYRKTMEGKCTSIACTRAKIDFCRKIRGPFEKLIEDRRFRSLGTRTECGCRQ
jgi:hypothetical protein